MRLFRRLLIFISDILIAPFQFFLIYLQKYIRKTGIFLFPINRYIFKHVGVYPLIDHYFDPMFDSKRLRHPLSRIRNLPGIKMQTDKQLELLKSFSFTDELSNIPYEKTEKMEYYYNNISFGPGDSDYLYHMIRYFKPKKIFEIGSGYSTLMAIKAIGNNILDDINYHCMQLCVEPYEAPWLEQTGIKVIRERVELIDLDVFKALKENDLLFIDSSHIIRPQGDVLFEYLEILPSLAPGVIVHIHDIFTPRDYPEGWIAENMCLWNEQYLLESFLTCTSEWEIMAALNWLKHEYFSEFHTKCPSLKNDTEPGSFYIRKLI
jgi:predicted O-methyltransferase YrrM